ncbi:MAG: peptidylprolyl isomerase [Candidatus Zixiibacteriota bacterium]|nr:MAG: peptidylprolyl isomerase [candidate division Zixibacteria bacterium]
MSQVKSGDKIKVHYTGKLEDGTVFDTSEGRDPFEFTVGAGNVIPGFDQGVMGMSEGATKTITVPPEEAYGQSRADLVAKVDKSAFPESIDPKVGQQLQMEQSDGDPINVVVSNIEGDTVTLDANHPLAGKTLIFEVELVSIG